MTANSLLKNLLHIKGAVVDSFDLGENAKGEPSLVVHVHVGKGLRWRCPVCGKKCHVHDYVCDEAFWRSMDLGPVEVRIGARVPRVRCPVDGVVTAAVPWAKPGSRFTTDFAFSAAWMVKGGLSKKKVSERLRIDWETVGHLVDLVWHELEPDVKKRFDGLVRIGIDETSYRKGHSYITVVVNHDTNTVVWAHKGHGREIIEMFFSELTEEQRASILLVSGDGARWITDAAKDFCPNARRCVDPFHVVEWANEALDSMRIDAWRRARAALAEMVRKSKEDGSANDRDARERIRQAKKDVEQIKQSKYALGKNPENLTTKQQERLALIQAGDPQLMRGHAMKEKLRLIFKLTDPTLAEEELDGWLGWAQRCRIPAFVELGRKIRRHKEHILNTVRNGLSNARIEATNNKIKLLLRVAYGFRNIDTMIGLIMLFCSSIEIPWPGRKQKEPINKGAITTQVA